MNQIQTILEDKYVLYIENDHMPDGTKLTLLSKDGRWQSQYVIGRHEEQLWLRHHNNTDKLYITVVFGLIEKIKKAEAIREAAPRVVEDVEKVLSEPKLKSTYSQDKLKHEDTEWPQAKQLGSNS